MNKIGLVLRFYLKMSLSNFFISIYVAMCIVSFGMDSFKVYTLGKIMSLCVILFFIDQRGKKQYAYFSNLGLSRIKLLISVFIIDLFIFILWLILCFRLW